MGATSGSPARGQQITEARQASLFDDSDLPGLTGSEADGSEHGYAGRLAGQAAGITYRQLDYWARTGLVEPSVRAASGSGSQRLYSFRDILVLRVVKQLLDAGASLHNIRTAIGHLRSRGVRDLATVTLVSDGATVYEYSSPEEIVDLLQGGQALFAIAVGPVARQVEGALAEFPVDRTDPGAAGAPESAASLAGDELATRRRRRAG